MCENIKAVILAGGFGSRLRPLTEGVPKPLLQIAACPCINHTVNLLGKYGINDIAVTTMYEGNAVRESLLKSFPDKNIKFFNEEKPLGTAGSVRAAKEFLSGDFIVIGGDALCDLDVSEAVAFHRKKGGIATVVLTEKDDPTEYGLVLSDCDGRVGGFIEKPDWSRAFSNTVNTGIYIFSNEIFDYIPENKFFDFSKDVFPKLLEENREIYAVKSDFYWQDIGSFDCYIEANRDMLSGKISRLDGKKNNLSGYPNTKIIPPCFIDEDCEIENAEIGPFTVLGKGCKINGGTRISGSVLSENVNVGSGCYIRNAVIGNGTVLYENTSVGENSVIGSGCEVGKNSIVSSGAVIFGGIKYPENSKISGRNFTLKKTGEIKSGKLIFGEDSNLFDILRWGYAYGSAVDGNIAFAFPEKAYSVTAQTFSSAVRDGGDNVYLLCETDFSGLKYIVRNFGFQGGIYMHKEDGGIILNFVDEDGLFVSSDKVREIQKKYDSEDFSYGKKGRLKVFNGFSAVYERHIERLFKGISPFASSVVAPSSIMFYLPFAKDNANEKFCITDERLRVFHSENGEETEYSKLAVSLVCLYVFGKIKRKVFIPENFTSAAEKIANEHGFSVRRIAFNSDERYLLYDFTDPVTSAAYLLRYLSENGLTFGEILGKMPEVYREEAKFEVGGREKARIMSELSREEKYKPLANGVKIILPDENSVVSVISSADKNGFRIYAESVKAETAKELCDIYVNKIKNRSFAVKNDTSK